MVTLQLRQLQVPAGQRLLIQEVSWSEFENILAAALREFHKALIQALREQSIT
jgi:hypothetical protein